LLAYFRPPDQERRNPMPAVPLQPRQPCVHHVQSCQTRHSSSLRGPNARFHALDDSRSPSPWAHDDARFRRRSPIPPRVVTSVFRRASPRGAVCRLVPGFTRPRYATDFNVRRTPRSAPASPVHASKDRRNCACAISIPSLCPSFNRASAMDSVRAGTNMPLSTHTRAA
jgi:hypothetical protein